MDVDLLMTTNKNICYNPSVSVLYENAQLHELGTSVSSTGALMCSSGDRTGRSPKDKRIVGNGNGNDNNIWWGHVNVPISVDSYKLNKKLALDYIANCKQIYVVDVYAGKIQYKKKFRIICTLAYHALFMKNMFLVAPDNDDSKPDFVIINAGARDADQMVEGVNSKVSININFADKCMVILGSMYAGEMKKGIFSILHYYYPIEYNILTLHSSANIGASNDVSIFFGLSGTGKTTLSMDPTRKLIGDDELAWYDNGVFNIENGCYAKVIHLSAQDEPYIFNAIKYGTVLENVVYNKETHIVDYDDASLTENTRASYPMSHVPIAELSGMGTTVKNIIMLTCDAYGVLPPIAKLTADQAMYYFISGYTSTMPSTVHGINEPKPEFSACFGDAFLTLNPIRYAQMLGEKISKTSAQVWLVNTGWFGGNAKIGQRYPISVSRTIIDKIHNGSLDNTPTYQFPLFGFDVPHGCIGLDDSLFYPNKSWTNQEKYQSTLLRLATLFIDNFAKFDMHKLDMQKLADVGPRMK